MKFTFTQITKALEKLFKAGFIDEKSILNMKLEDLLKLDNLTNAEISIIIEFKKAIRSKNIIKFLSSDYSERKSDNNA